MRALRFRHGLVRLGYQVATVPAAVARGHRVRNPRRSGPPEFQLSRDRAVSEWTGIRRRRRGMRECEVDTTQNRF
jgi:hypothetical protein